jgi:hypothetical protein
MFADIDWCNIYHVCVGNRDNIFLCPPGTIFNGTQQGCMDRFDGTNCNGTRSYYKPSIKRHKRFDLQAPSGRSQLFTDLKQSPRKDNNQQIPYKWKESYKSRQVLSFKRPKSNNWTIGSYKILRLIQEKNTIFDRI